MPPEHLPDGGSPTRQGPRTAEQPRRARGRQHEIPAPKRNAKPALPYRANRSADPLFRAIRPTAEPPKRENTYLRAAKNGPLRPAARPDPVRVPARRRKGTANEQIPKSNNEKSTPDSPPRLHGDRGCGTAGHGDRHAGRCRHRGGCGRRRGGSGAREIPRKEEIFHLGLQGLAEHGGPRIRRIHRHVQLHRLPLRDADFRRERRQAHARTHRTRARSHADRRRGEGGQSAARLAEGRHGELQRRSLQGDDRFRRGGAAEEDARHQRVERHGRGPGRGSQEGLRRWQGVFRRGRIHGHKIAAGRGGGPHRSLQQAERQRRIFGHGRRRGL